MTDAMATDNDLNKYRANLSQSLNNIYIPYSALLCNDMKCVDFDQFAAINQDDEPPSFSALTLLVWSSDL